MNAAPGITPIWPSGTNVCKGQMRFGGIGVAELVERFGTPVYLMDLDTMVGRAQWFRDVAVTAFPNVTTHVSYSTKAFISKEVVRLLLRQGLFIDTCSMGEMRIALAAGAPGRRMVLHGNNKSDDEIALAIEQGFAKIVVDEPDEPARIAAIAHRLGKVARVMLRVTVGIHAGGHEYISTAHEDQKFGVPLLKGGSDPTMLEIDFSAGAGGPSRSTGSRSADGSTASRRLSSLYAHTPQEARENSDDELARAMDAIADGPALGVLKDIHSRSEDLELVGIHAHIGSQIHDAAAYAESAKRLMLLRRTFWATDGFMLPEVDLGGGFSIAYTDSDTSMDIESTMAVLSDAISATTQRLGLPAPVLSFEPGRWIAGPSGVTLYRVGTVKPVRLSDGTVRTYVSVDGGMSDNIRPALYGADYAVRLANRCGSDSTMLVRVVGKHCESGDVVVHDAQLPEDVQRGDILAVPVTGAYCRTMASNYNQLPTPAVIGISEGKAHVLIKAMTIEDLLALDQD
ncbi:MAG: diaminopimelate decarboxylase [Bifidobacterium sp.]|uniref:Diaminopimelate decarboxylase n=1 Tax=Bifidobacterium fermentum TaxID=3059035 RepID=A0AB39UH70_9BIFI